MKRGDTAKILYFTRSTGFEHPVIRREGGHPSHSEQVLTELGSRDGYEVKCTKDEGVFDGDLDEYDLVVFYTSGAPLTPGGKQNLLDAVTAGKGFVGFHSASDTFHSAGQPDPYIRMLGGEFVKHAKQQEASLLLTSRFPGAGTMGMASGVSFTEEWYALKNFAPDLHVILVQETLYMRGECYRRPNYPSTWARMHGQGRVFYTSLGHREDLWINPFFQAIASGGIAWALGRKDYDIQPNLAEVTQEANKLRS